MGWDRHHAIIVTSYDRSRMLAAHRVARRIFRDVSPLVKSGEFCNTLLIPPDITDSIEDSDAADKRRKDFITWLNYQNGPDGSPAYAWVEVQYGNEARICRESERQRKTA